MRQPGSPLGYYCGPGKVTPSSLAEHDEVRMNSAQDVVFIGSFMNTRVPVLFRWAESCHQAC